MHVPVLADTVDRWNQGCQWTFRSMIGWLPGLLTRTLNIPIIVIPVGQCIELCMTQYMFAKNTIEIHDTLLSDYPWQTSKTWRSFNFWRLYKLKLQAILQQARNHLISPVGSVVKRITSNDKITGSIPVRGTWFDQFFFLPDCAMYLRQQVLTTTLFLLVLW